MKKRLLLFVIPALMALSSCTYLASGAAQPKGNFFKEEANACEEVFGKVKAANFRNEAPNRSVEEDLAEPVIGVQYRAKYQKDAKDYIAVRFVAAVKSLDVNASWTRSVYNPDGTRYGSLSTIPTTQAYAELNSNDKPITPAAFAGDDSYNYFVAYTLYDIPFESKDDYTIVAYLKLSDTSDVNPFADSYSLAMGVKIGGGAYAKFHRDYNGFFMYGTIDTVENRLADADYPKKDEAVAATFTSYLTSGDKFAIFQQDLSNNFFRIWDGSKVSSPDAKVGVIDGMVSIGSSRRYMIKLNTSNQIVYSAYGDNPIDVYLRGPAAHSGGDNGWGDANESARFYDDPTNDGSIRYTFPAEDINKEFKICNKSAWDWSVGWGDKLHGGANDGVHLANADGNIKVLIAGTYDFYVNSGEVWVYFIRALPAA